MANDLPTYTQRVARIAATLEPYLHVGRYVLGTPEPNPLEAPNGLASRWFDQQTGRPEVSVFIDQLANVENSLANLRARVTGVDYYEPGMASEINGLAPGEYAFLQHYANAVTAIVGNCRVSIHPPDEYRELAVLVEPALDIGRTVGCSAYRNDFSRPPIPDQWRNPSQGIGPGFPGFPPTVPPGPAL